jgi:hypothetical protein
VEHEVFREDLIDGGSIAIAEFLQELKEDRFVFLGRHRFSTSSS